MVWTVFHPAGVPLSLKSVTVNVSVCQPDLVMFQDWLYHPVPEPKYRVSCETASGSGTISY